MTAEGRPAVEFWFDFASTYSHLAAQRIGPLAAAAGVELRWRPFLLGPIFAAQGWNTSPFNLQPAKGANMWRDIERLAALHGVAWRRPSAMPRNGLAAARIAVLAEDEGWAGAFCRAVFRANFFHDRDIADRAILAEALAACGGPADALARSAAEANKARLRAQTERAVAMGVFGAPAFTVGAELFWGHDRLEQALAWARRPWL